MERPVQTKMPGAESKITPIGIAFSESGTTVRKKAVFQSDSENVKNKKITIRDIARQCGTSISTVSRVINGSAVVDEKLKANILDVIRASSWQSNNLRLKFSKKARIRPHVVLISPYVQKPNFNAVELVTQLCHRLDYEGVFFFGYSAQTMAFCKCLKPHALILVSGVGSYCQDVEDMAKAGTRVLYLGNSELEPHVGGSCYPSIREFIRFCIQKLQDAGHTKIGYFGQFGEFSHFTNPKQHTARQNDAVAALQEAIPGFDIEKDTVGDCYGDYTALQRALQEKRITAWICATGPLGDILYREATKSGIHIPQDCSILTVSALEFMPNDVSVVAIDNSALEQEVSHFLTSGQTEYHQMVFPPILLYPEKTLGTLCQSSICHDGHTFHPNQSHTGQATPFV